jgi:hypothetical protein
MVKDLSPDRIRSDQRDDLPLESLRLSREVRRDEPASTPPASRASSSIVSSEAAGTEKGLPM